MIKLPLYFHSICYGWVPHQEFLKEHFKDFSDGGKFHTMIARLISDNMLIPRVGEWSLPWPTEIIPSYEMPAYDENFKLSFSEITDLTGMKTKKLINEGKNVVVFYSGGIDSNVCVTSLLKNLNDRELKSVRLVLSYDSIIENPMFFEQYIKDKFTLLDSNTTFYSDIIDESSDTIPITLDQGDSLFGTEFGTKMYSKFYELINEMGPESKNKLKHLYNGITNEDVHYSKYEDLLIHYFSRSSYKEFKYNQTFGRLYYNKIVKNINSSPVPVHSLHDFFWWLIFNVKYMHCAIRSSVYYGTEDRMKEGIEGRVFNWFGTNDYQKWSMVNNNNGEKLNGLTQPRYKWAARKYIYEFDKNNWAFNYKLKIPSLRNLYVKNFKNLKIEKVFGVDSDFRLLTVDNEEVRDFMLQGLKNYQIDW